MKKPRANNHTTYEEIPTLNPLAGTPALWRNLIRAVGSAMAEYGLRSVTIDLNGSHLTTTTTKTK